VFLLFQFGEREKGGERGWKEGKRPEHPLYFHFSIGVKVDLLARVHKAGKKRKEEGGEKKREGLHLQIYQRNGSFEGIIYVFDFTFK